MESIDIDPDGDVVLVCGEGDDQQRLRVCSKNLSQASPVFKAMLSPRFHEGTRLRDSGSIKLNLPEDSAASMTIVCRIAHLQHRSVSKLMGPGDLLELSRLCDKYDLVETLSTHAEGWINFSLETTSIFKIDWCSDGDRLLMAAYKLGSAAMFAKVGRAIVTKGVDLLEGTERKRIAADVGEDLDRVFDALAAERKRVQDYLNDEIADLIENEATRREEAYHCTSDCTFAEKLLHFVIENLRLKKLWPPKDLRPMSLEAAWQALDSHDWALCKLYQYEIFECNGSNGFPCLGDVFEDNCLEHIPHWFERAKTNSRDMIRYLCYECVRRGEEGLVEECEHYGPREE